MRIDHKVISRKGDIVELKATKENTLFPNNCFISEVFVNEYGVQLSQGGSKQVVQPNKEGLKGDWVHTGWYLLGGPMQLAEAVQKNYIVEVIGNIHENPELLNN